jgi:hypothetical protein
VLSSPTGAVPVGVSATQAIWSLALATLAVLTARKRD